VKEIMKQGNAESMVMDGREGWGRMLKGAKMIKVTYEVSL